MLWLLRNGVPSGDLPERCGKPFRRMATRDKKHAVCDIAMWLSTAILLHT
jgi:hypothetical protein